MAKLRIVRAACYNQNVTINSTLPGQFCIEEHHLQIREGGSSSRTLTRTLSHKQSGLQMKTTMLVGCVIGKLKFRFEN